MFNYLNPTACEGTRYVVANKGMDTRRLQHYLGHGSITKTPFGIMSRVPFGDIWR